MDALLQKQQMTESEIRALCYLVREEDGKSLPKLESDLAGILKTNPDVRQWILGQPELASNKRIREILEFIGWDDIVKTMKMLHIRQGQTIGLEDALILLSTFSGSLNSPEQITRPLDQMAVEIGTEIRESADADAVIRNFKHYVFRIKGYHGNTSHFYDPDNSYLHKVLEKKVGIPISLSVACLLLAKRLRWQDKPLPLVGIGLPGHFIVQFRLPGKSVYMDPFNRGRFLTRRDCIDLLRNQEIPFQESYLNPVDSHTVITRSITNLVHIYTDLDDQRRKEKLLEILQILNPGRQLTD